MRRCKFCKKEKDYYVPLAREEEYFKGKELDWNSTLMASQPKDDPSKVVVVYLVCRQCFKKDKFGD